MNSEIDRSPGNPKTMLFQRHYGEKLSHLLLPEEKSGIPEFD
jgi:hypothetical protein